MNRSAKRNVSVARKWLEGFGLAALGGSLLTGTVRFAKADTPVLGFTQQAIGVEDTAADVFQDPTGSFLLGWTFKPVQDVVVDSLGYWNDVGYDPSTPFNSLPLNGRTGSYVLSQAHAVGLFAVVAGVGGAPETGTLLASTTVTAAGEQEGQFFYQSLPTAVALSAGKEYLIEGVSGPLDPYLFNCEDDSMPGSVGLLVDPAITFGENRYAIGSDLQTFAGNSDFSSSPGYFGPAFRIAVANTPEPSCLLLMTTGIIIIVGGSAFRRRPIQRGNSIMKRLRDAEAAQTLPTPRAMTALRSFVVVATLCFAGSSTAWAQGPGTSLADLVVQVKALQSSVASLQSQLKALQSSTGNMAYKIYPTVLPTRTIWEPTFTIPDNPAYNAYFFDTSVFDGPYYLCSARCFMPKASSVPAGTVILLRETPSNIYIPTYPSLDYLEYSDFQVYAQPGDSIDGGEFANYNIQPGSTIYHTIAIRLVSDGQSKWWSEQRIVLTSTAPVDSGG